MYERSRSKPSLVKRSFFFETSRLIVEAPGRLLMCIPGRTASMEFRPLGFEAFRSRGGWLLPLASMQGQASLSSQLAREQRHNSAVTSRRAETTFFLIPTGAWPRGLSDESCRGGH